VLSDLKRLFGVRDDQPEEILSLRLKEKQLKGEIGDLKSRIYLLAESEDSSSLEKKLRQAQSALSETAAQIQKRERLKRSQEQP